MNVHVTACAQMNAEVFLKATKVDGVYDSDPFKNPNARRYDQLSYRCVRSRVWRARVCSVRCLQGSCAVGSGGARVCTLLLDEHCIAHYESFVLVRVGGHPARPWPGTPSLGKHPHMLRALVPPHAPERASPTSHACSPLPPVRPCTLASALQAGVLRQPERHG